MVSPTSSVQHEVFWAKFGMSEREICFFPNQQKKRPSGQLPIHGTCRVLHPSTVLSNAQHLLHTRAIQDAITHVDGFVLVDKILAYAEAVSCRVHKAEHLADSMRAKAFLLARSLRQPAADLLTRPPRQSPSELIEEAEAEDDQLPITPQSCRCKKARRQLISPPQTHHSAMMDLSSAQTTPSATLPKKQHFGPSSRSQPNISLNLDSVSATKVGAANVFVASSDSSATFNFGQGYDFEFDFDDFSFPGDLAASGGLAGDSGLGVDGDLLDEAAWMAAVPQDEAAWTAAGLQEADPSDLPASGGPAGDSAPGVDGEWCSSGAWSRRL
ncbi:hypothetical protein CB0940_12261 [Cercospora beticola]|uniref:Uncharacterized protein n=1 Tax=Cercospora beticola TaxID=122368 RepID=A0A2G5H453_CERBT|nr:hypothetical protein CB0940_12261 [Cercospora beticola]PIA87300.1 hypothetical protein CB0940_12261 [Cercospora beticola]WPB08482.1 hypothetical protein RHO25_013148 [Cercospora beticola]CAK1356661.1 unnamed protein product [Cercospora beticola]